ncbi:hypothetical protein KC19_3G255800 [Ceratodon purpureus]|uniref:VWFA domain-containing protein n=1 Tax=Ceratodon purpureus TaxID=3225 RepID=A0A8T0IMT4_CERPU|nr:hypothetical protein KC19_3G255800 [Ceratodon purpureus]
MLIVFLLDTSASMNQRCNNGLSLLDCAKSAVEHFHKVRSRDASCRVDRYMLVTCDEGADYIKVVDKYPFTHFMRALKSVQARDLTNLGAALHRIFSFLHVQRLALDIDRYGQGRNPCVNDLTTILLLTDGTELTSLNGVSINLQPNGPPAVGSELAQQQFRWDQRVFATVLRIPSVSAAVLERSGPIPQNAPISGAPSALVMDTNISQFCEYTGGKCFVATSWKVLMQHTEVTASRLPPCVIVSFEPMSNSATLPPQVQQACHRKMLLVRGGQIQGQGHWPIPEAYWPDPTHQGISPREPHPMITYKPVDADPHIPPNFIFDKYEIESNPIMGFLLKANAGACWQVFVRNSKGTNHGYGDPFGYLRLNRVGSNLTLFVLPYNYPVLWQLLEQLGKMPGQSKMSPSAQWRQDMERYCSSIPAYYGPPLRGALKRWGINAHVVPESMESNLYTGFVGTQLKRFKSQAKELFDADMARIMVGQQMVAAGNVTRPLVRTLPQSNPPTAEAPPGFTSTTNPATHQRGIGHGEQVSARRSGWELLLPNGPTPALTAPPYVPTAPYPPQLNMPGPEMAAPTVPTGIMKDISLFKNPFDIPRDQLLSQLQYLPIRVALALESRQSRRLENREVGKPSIKSSLSNLATLLAAKEEDDARHSLPIEKMGDFNDALLKQQPPRNPYAEEPDRTKQQRMMFGNPYRQEKNDGGADEGWSEGTGGLLQRGRKRRRRIQQQGDTPSSPSLSSSPSSSNLSSLADSSAETSSPNTEVTSPQRGQQSSIDIVTTGTADGKTVEPGSGLLERKDNDYRGLISGSDTTDKGNMLRANLKTSLSIPEKLNEYGDKMRAVEKADNENDLEVANDLGSRALDQGRRKRHMAPLGMHQEQSHVVAFLLSVIRALRYSKSSNTKQLFELLSVPDFPVDKGNFLEQLILQAHRYNKLAVAKMLVEYRNSLITTQPDNAGST